MEDPTRPTQASDVRWPPGGAYPAFATLTDWQRLSGISRSRTYELLAAGQLRAVKLGGRTLIDVEAGLAWMRGLPPAAIAKAPVAG